MKYCNVGNVREAVVEEGRTIHVVDSEVFKFDKNLIFIAREVKIDKILIMISRSKHSN